MDPQVYKGDRPLRVFLWMVPRTNSTAFTKCMSFVDDTEVWLEPYLSCHLNETFYNPEWGKGIPAVEGMRRFFSEFMKKEEFIAMKKQEVEKANQYKNVWLQDVFSYPWLKKQLEVDTDGKKFVFIKEESCAIKDHLEYLPEVPTRHTFLIRHPQEMYTSFKNACVNSTDFLKIDWDEFNVGDNIPHLPVKDFFQIHHNHWKYVKENLDPNPIIIDGFDLISKPEVILPKFFANLGIPFKESYLQWEGDPELVYSSWKGSSEFVFTASKTTSTSRAVECTGFDPPKNPRGTSRPEWKITNELKEYIEGALPFYEEMYANRLT